MSPTAGSAQPAISSAALAKVELPPNEYPGSPRATASENAPKTTPATNTTSRGAQTTRQMVAIIGHSDNGRAGSGGRPVRRTWTSLIKLHRRARYGASGRVPQLGVFSKSGVFVTCATREPPAFAA